MIVTVTSLQEIATSGWCPMSSAGSTTRVDELHRADEVAAVERLADRVAVARPAVELAELRLDLLVGKYVPSPSDGAIVGRRCMRIASLVPSATEMLFALGLGDDVAAVTHECDYPPGRARASAPDPQRDPGRPAARRDRRRACAR